MFLTKDSRDGIYYIFFNVNGKRKRKSLSTRDPIKAQKIFSTWNGDIDKADYKIETQTNHLNSSLKDISEFIRNYARDNYCRKTSELYDRTYKILMNVYGDNTVFSTIGINEIEKYKIECRKYLSATTVNMQLRCLKAGFNIAIKYGMIERNPAKGVKQLNELEKEKIIIDKANFEILTRSIKEKNFRNFVIFGCYTGCRSSELCNLQWSDLDLERNILTIKNKTNFKTKTGKIRRIPISDILMKIILEMKIKNAESNIFLTQKGNPYDKGYVSHKFRRCVREAKLSKSLHFHSLRHTFIT